MPAGAYSSRLVLPRRMAPAARSFTTIVASLGSLSLAKSAAAPVGVPAFQELEARCGAGARRKHGVHSARHGHADCEHGDSRAKVMRTHGSLSRVNYSYRMLPLLRVNSPRHLLSCASCWRTS